VAALRHGADAIGPCIFRAIGDAEPFDPMKFPRSTPFFLALSSVGSVWLLLAGCVDRPFPEDTEGPALIQKRYDSGQISQYEYEQMMDMQEPNWRAKQAAAKAAAAKKAAAAGNTTTGTTSTGNTTTGNTTAPADGPPLPGDVQPYYTYPSNSM